ncbi:hypothetical protein [Marinobacterium aestuariivivens]|uniref:Fanconi-associated nuclease 1 SAP domain-containing protein n=1 Tax=Marinobacterium aestuariivivens TaxID=1698799 RepID=A0ABW2A3C2_9GAMM
MRYAEIGPSEKALAPLVDDGWIDPQPALTLTGLFALLTRAELATALRSQLDALGLRPSAAKGQMFEALSAADFDPQPLAQWWPDSTERVLALTSMPLFERIRLMFFGNLRQDWSEFVLAELGHQRYETVPLAPESRAFQTRSEVDSYLHLHRCRERLDAGEPAAGVWADVPSSRTPTPGSKHGAPGCCSRWDGPPSAAASRRWRSRPGPKAPIRKRG